MRIIEHIFDKKNVSPEGEAIRINGQNNHAVYAEILIKGAQPHMELAKDDSAVEVLMPRHRSLFDYSVGQPVHHRLINPHVTILAGDNLFVGQFNHFMRKFGAFKFLRKDATLKYPGLSPVSLSRTRYIDELLPEYLKYEMIDAKGLDKKRMDLMIYAEQEKHPITKKRGGGRSKTGKLRDLSHLFFDKFRSISRDSGVQLYIVPVNVGFSKVPEVPFIVDPPPQKGIMRAIRYALEQHFCFIAYPKFAIKNPKAKLSAIIKYGEPMPLETNFESMRDLLKYSNHIRDKIGKLESIFPVTLIYHAMKNQEELSLKTLEERMKKLIDKYQEQDIDVNPCIDQKGNLLPVKEMTEQALEHLNLNPAYLIKEAKNGKFLKLKGDQIISLHPAVQKWYYNNLVHLD